MSEPHLRAADADRAAVATVLGHHMSAGRLTLDEYDERLARAYAAKTYGELEQLTADLPPTTSAPVPAQEPAAQPAQQGWCSAAPAGAHGGWGSDANSWRSWLTTSLIVIAIWAATSLASWELHNFWPIWVIGPWGAILLAQTLTGGRDGSSDGDRELRA
jgi:hypothetical protein